MDDSTPKTYSPIRRDTGNRDGPPEIDLRSEYQKMTMSLRRNPRSIVNFKELLSKILEPLAKTKGELLILDDGKKIYFARDGTPFTDFGVILLAVIQVYSIEQVQYFVELLILGQDVEVKTIKIEARRIESSHWIEDLGVCFMYEKKALGRLNALVRMMAKYAPVIEEYQYSGWKPGEGNCYIMGGRQLCGADWEVCKAKFSCLHTLDMLDIASHSLTIPLLSIELLSLVHSKMQAQGTYFKGVCCIVAPTQSYKTTLASLFFDHQNGTEADINFEATMAAMIRTVGNIRDATVVVDDYKPGATKAERNEMLRKLSTIVRMCSDDSGGIKKAGIQNSTISNTAHGMVVVTAEQIQLSVQSTLARLLILEMNRKSVDVEKLTHFQETHARYREFVGDYIRFIGEQGVDNYCKNLVHRFQQERRILQKDVPEDTLVDNRTNDMCVWLHISFTEFLKYAVRAVAIDQGQLDDYMRESVKIFRVIMTKQAERVAELDDTTQFFKGLQVLLDTKEANIEKLQPRNSSFSAPNSKSAIGFSKGGYIYLKNNVALQQVIAYHHRFGREFAVSESALRKNLADNGFLIASTKKSYIHRLYINQEKYQCMKFEEKKFYQLLKGGRRNGSEVKREVPDHWGMQQNAENFLGRGI